MSDTVHDFGRGPIACQRLPNNAVTAVSASVSEAAKLEQGCLVGAAVEVGPEAVIGKRAYIGRASRIEARSHIAEDGIVGERNDGHLHVVVPGGPYVIDAHYLRDGRLWFTVGCESHSLDHWEEHWEEIAARNGFNFSPIVVALFPVARLLAMPEVHV